jgi:hypothetical protein
MNSVQILRGWETRPQNICWDSCIMIYDFILLGLLKCSCTFMPKSYKLQIDLALKLLKYFILWSIFKNSLDSPIQGAFFHWNKYTQIIELSTTAYLFWRKHLEWLNVSLGDPKWYVWAIDDSRPRWHCNMNSLHTK